MEDIINETPDVLRIKVPAGEEVRCPWWNVKLGRVCNKKFFNGRPSIEPQEFKCKCGKKTIFVRLG